MHDLKERIFWWLFRPFLGRRRLPVPEGVTDAEIMRRSAQAGVKWGNLLWFVLVWMQLAWALVLLNGWVGLEPTRQTDDIHFSTSSVWLGALFMSGGLVILVMGLKSLMGHRLSEDTHAAELAFEAKHKVNAGRAYAFLGVLCFVMGATFASVADDYVAFDRQTLRWRHFFTPHVRSITDIAEVRFYRYREVPRGGPKKRETACVLFKDGTRFLSSDGFMDLGMTKADCVRLARVAGVPALLDLNVLPLDP